MEISVSKRLLSVKEAAFLLGISSRSIYNGTSSRAKKPFPIRPIRVGGSIRFDIRDIDAYLEQQKAKSGAL